MGFLIIWCNYYIIVVTYDSFNFLAYNTITNIRSVAGSEDEIAITITYIFVHIVIIHFDFFIIFLLCWGRQKVIQHIVKLFCDIKIRISGQRPWIKSFLLAIPFYSGLQIGVLPLILSPEMLLPSDPEMPLVSSLKIPLPIHTKEQFRLLANLYFKDTFMLVDNYYIHKSLNRSWLSEIIFPYPISPRKITYSFIGALDIFHSEFNNRWDVVRIDWPSVKVKPISPAYYDLYLRPKPYIIQGVPYWEKVVGKTLVRPYFSTIKHIAAHKLIEWVGPVLKKFF